MASGSDKKLQGFTAFNSGEYSRDLAGRTDLESFGSSTRFSSNFLTQVSGGLKKFYGTYHITEINSTTENVVLIPFINKYEPMAFVVFAATDPDATGLKVGLIHGNSYKVMDVELPLTVVPRELRWQQINDRLILCHHTIQPISIDFYGIDDDGEYVFNTNVISFKEIPYFPIGTTNDYTGPLISSGLSSEITLSLPSGASEIMSYFPSILSTQSTYTRSASKTKKGRYADYSVGNTIAKLFRVRANVSTELASGVVNSVSAKKQIRVWAYDTTDYILTVTDTVNRERVLQTIKSICPNAYVSDAQVVMPNLSGHQNGDSYYIEIITGNIVIEGSVYVTGGTYMSASYTPIETTTSGINAERMLGRKIKFFFNDDEVISPWWQSKSVTTGDYAYSNGHWYKALTSGTCGNIQPSHTVGVRSDGGVNWLYVHSGSNTGTVTEVIDETSMKVFVPNGELPKNTNNVYKNYAWSIWGKDGVHPSEVYMVGGRLGFVCNTANYGAWNAMSVTDDYFNFDTEEYGEQLDTSAIVSIVGNNEASNINWVLARTRLYMGGYSGEYFINPGGSNRRSNVYTPTTTVIENISNMGGKSVIPLKYKELNMFVGMTGQELYTIAYDYTTDDYTPRMLGYLTQHIMERGIKRIEALNNLDRNIYLLHDTEQLSLFNYAAEQKVMGFTELDFADRVLDFVTTHANAEVAAYAITVRNEGKLTIERLATIAPTYVFDEMTQGDGETVAAFAPVPHFANRTVWIKYDNNQFVKVELDANGDVSHDPLSGVKIPEAKQFKVGLPMVSEVHTQPAFGQKLEGHQQQSLTVYMRLNKSGSFDYGCSVDFSKYFKYEAWNLQQEYDEAHRLYTGDIKLDIPLGYAEAQNQGEGTYPNTSGVGINIKSDTPEPLNILSMQEIYI